MALTVRRYFFAWVNKVFAFVIDTPVQYSEENFVCTLRTVAVYEVCGEIRSVNSMEKCLII